MRIEVDGGAVLTAAAHLRARAALVGDRAGDGVVLADGLRDPGLGAAAAALGDLLGDVLAVAALDLDLLATRLRDGVELYDRVEQRARDATGRP